MLQRREWLLLAWLQQQTHISPGQPPPIHLQKMNTGGAEQIADLSAVALRLRDSRQPYIQPLPAPNR